MKFQAVLTISVLAFAASHASAETAPTRLAAASPAETAVAPSANPKPQLPPAQAAIDPVSEGQAAQNRRPATRPVARRPQPHQQSQQPRTWQERMRAMWGLENRPEAPAQATPAPTYYPQAPAYSSRPNLLFGRFYSVIPRQTVTFKENYAPGTIIVRHREKRLYYVLGNGQAIRYAVAVGREGAAWSGVSRVSDKREWPSWTPTPEILRRQPNLPRHMEGGPQNPMGARALYLGDTLYRIHGTNEPWMIGHEVSSGCIRMTNEDVIDLYNRTRMGATVIVQR